MTLIELQTAKDYVTQIYVTSAKPKNISNSLCLSVYIKLIFIKLF
jgi:hypothetical protein